MRAFPLVALALALAVPPAAAEFGGYDANGYAVSVLGESTFPGDAVPAGFAVPLAAATFDPREFGPIHSVNGLTVYPYWPVLTAEVERLASEHPDVVRLHSAGKSTLGLDLWMLEIADFARIDAGDGIPLEDRETVWIDGGTHSNEYSGVYFVAHVASFLADEYASNETARWIVENRHTWLLPMVNPDGSHAMGRLNARAVNVNRNYPVDWGALAEDPVLNNPGPAPASEVETRINIEWFNATRPDYYASVHCCGNLWLYPYGVEGLDPVDKQVFERVCEDALASVREDCGPIWSTIYPASGSSVDTAYEFTGAVAFGFEMSGRGALALWGQPFTVESVRVQEVESWNAVMHAFLNVEKYGALPSIVSVRASGSGLEVGIVNDGYGNLTAGALALTDSAGVLRRADLPRLAPGERATIALPASLAWGELALAVEYAKREEAAPAGLVRVPLLLRSGSDADPQLLSGSAVVVVLEDASRGVPAPAVGPVLALAFALALGVARRRGA